MKLLLTLTALIATLNANITLPKSFESGFKQSITSDKGNVINYDGSVIFQNIEGARSLFKWNYLSPTKKEVCTDSIQLIVVDHDLEQVSNYRIDEGIDLVSILDIAEKITESDYKAKYKDTEYLITVDKKQQLKKIIYVDNLDNGVKIIFTNMAYNKEIEINKLECTAPQEYDIIEG